LTVIHDIAYGAVIMAQPLRELTQFICRMQNSTGWPLSLGPSQLAWAAGLPEWASIFLFYLSFCICTVYRSYNNNSVSTFTIAIYTSIIV